MIKSYKFSISKNDEVKDIEVKGDPLDNSFDVSSKEAGNEYKISDNDFSIPTTVIDIGAGYGEFALECLELGASEVICFEPNPKVFKFLESNLDGYRNFTTLENKAVLDYSGKTKLFYMDHRTAAGSVADVQINPDSERALSRLSAEVEVIDILSVFEMVKYKNIIFKLDAEGCEYKIISKIPNIKNINFLKKLFIEYHFGPQDIVRTLDSLGFNSEIEIKEELMGLINSVRKNN